MVQARPCMPDFLHPHLDLNSETQAFDLLYSGSSRPRSPKVRADKWINLRNTGDFSVSEDSIQIANDAIITLIWWKDASQLDSLPSR